MTSRNPSRHCSRPHWATVNKSLAHLERIKVVGELTSRRRGRVFSDTHYVRELSAELDLP